MALFVRELGELYSAFVEGKPPPLPELPLQYADFALWQREWMQGDTLERHMAYWRGFRIELGEIESALSLHPAVRHTVVLVREDSPGDKRLVAYVVPQVGAHLSLAKAREHLKKTLPVYMVPTAIVELDELPLTANGKVDRRSLPTPDWSRPEARSDYIAPEGPVEEAIAAVFAEVLKLEQVGRDDNFFEIGGHSLSAAEAVLCLSEKLQVTVPLRCLIESPNVAALGDAVEAMRRTEQKVEMPAVVASQKRLGLPLSIAQEALWYQDQLAPGNPFYNIPLVSRLRGPLDVSALERAVAATVERHELLRSVFLSSNGSPLLFPVKKWRGKLEQTDLRHLPSWDREREAQRIVREASVRPFDLTRDSMLR